MDNNYNIINNHIIHWFNIIKQACKGHLEKEDLGKLIQIGAVL